MDINEISKRYMGLQEQCELARQELIAAMKSNGVKIFMMDDGTYVRLSERHVSDIISLRKAN